MKENIPLTEAALQYAQSGFQVIPLWPNGKDPLRGFPYCQPSSDAELIQYWWKRCPEANIGIPTGRKFNSLVILDLDHNVKEGINGEEVLVQMMERENIVLPRTAISRTGSGGKHIYFRLTKDIKIDSTNGIKSGIDIVSEGAHVVAPPSTHKNGCKYKWIEGDFNDIATANESVIQIIKTIKEYG